MKAKLLRSLSGISANSDDEVKELAGKFKRQLSSHHSHKNGDLTVRFLSYFLPLRYLKCVILIDREKTGSTSLFLFS